MIANLLNKIEKSYSRDFIDSDPVGVVHELSGRRNIEVGGLYAAILALGRASLIRAKSRELFKRFEERPDEFIRESSPGGIEHRLKGFKHRFFDEKDFIEFTLNLRRILLEKGSLAAAWRRHAPFQEALVDFCAALSKGSRGAAKNLMPSPLGGSPCKRTMMFLRWMVRKDEIDFGFWKFISPSELIIPLDTHVFRISRLLGLTKRKSASWQAAVDITDRLREICPEDPVKYDFALSRIGIVAGCRGKLGPACAECLLRSACIAGK